MKKIYEAPEMQMILLDNVDILTASIGDDTAEDNFPEQA